MAAGVVAEIEKQGGRAIWVQADVSDAAAVRRLFDETERAFGGVDVVVSNAGIMRLAAFHAMSDDDFTRMLDVNQKGSFFVLREGRGERAMAAGSSRSHRVSPSSAVRHMGRMPRRRSRRTCS